MGGFVIIDKPEFAAKLKRLVQGMGLMYLWKRGEKNFSLVPRLIEEKTSSVLHVHFSPQEGGDYQLGQEFLFYFMQGPIQYFSSGNLVQKEESWILEIRADAFKREKRKNERLLTFPHHQVFALFQAEEEVERTNILNLDKMFEKKKTIFSNFLKRNSSDEGLKGFRVLDISQNGFSYTASKNEIKVFSEGQIVSAKIKFNGEFFEIPEVKIIHVVDYIDPRFGHVPMYKIGAQVLKTNELLKEKIVVLLGEENKRVAVGNDFENFLK